MHSLRNSVYALWILVLALALVGCHKSTEATPPKAAVSGAAPSSASPAAGDRTEAQATSNSESDEPKPEPNRTHPVFVIDTTAGKITVRLDAEKAPLTVDNFANYVACGHYDQTIFHQTVKAPVQIVIGGVYTSDMKEKSSFTPIRNEADHALKNRRGTIAMLRSRDDEDSATCQFFFNISDNEALDFRSPSAKEKAPTAEEYGFCAFGEVTEGMDVLDQIAKGPVYDLESIRSRRVEPVAIRSIRQLR